MAMMQTPQGLVVGMIEDKAPAKKAEAEAPKKPERPAPKKAAKQ